MLVNLQMIDPFTNVRRIYIFDKLKMDANIAASWQICLNLPY